MCRVTTAGLLGISLCQERDMELIERQLTEQIIAALIEVHKYWGPGLYEEIYERSLMRELTLRGLKFENQLRLPLIYKDERVGEDLRLDLLVEGRIIVEIKAVKQLLPVHECQIMTYMRLTGSRVGLLVNFNVPLIKEGIRRFVL
jgi:GxxExxY protein